MAADYQLVVYNAVGPEMARFSGHSEAGVAEVEWDASDHASGVYLYKLNSDKFTDTKRMVVLK